MVGIKKLNKIFNQISRREEKREKKKKKNKKKTNNNNKILHFLTCEQ
jgi:hypothetical protein